jgi:hypothetical protein
MKVIGPYAPIMCPLPSFMASEHLYFIQRFLTRSCDNVLIIHVRISQQYRKGLENSEKALSSPSQQNGIVFREVFVTMRITHSLIGVRLSKAFSARLAVNVVIGAAIDGEV